MKSAILNTLLAATALCSAGEMPNFSVLHTTLTPKLPEWAIDEEDEESTDTTPHMELELYAQWAFFDKKITSQAAEEAYSVNETDEWQDWQEDDIDSDEAPILTGISFSGTLTDANGKILHAGEWRNMQLELEEDILYWHQQIPALPDSMQLQLKGTLCFTAWNADSATPTATFSLKPTAQNYAWASIDGYNVILESNVPQDADEEEDDEGEAAFDTIDDEDIPEPINKTTQTNRTATMRIEAPADMLLRVFAISAIAPDGREISCTPITIDQDNNCIEVPVKLDEHHRYRLHLLSTKKEYRYELNQPLYLNGRQ